MAVNPPTARSSFAIWNGRLTSTPAGYGRRVCANTGHSPRTCRTGQIDPQETFGVEAINGRNGPGSSRSGTSVSREIQALVSVSRFCPSPRSRPPYDVHNRLRGSASISFGVAQRAVTALRKREVGLACRPSSAAIEALTADWAILSASAARVTCWRSATATKTRSCSSVIGSTLSGYRRRRLYEGRLEALRNRLAAPDHRIGIPSARRGRHVS